MNKDLSVLIIDDDVDICFLLELIFKGYNVPCLSANSLEAAKKKLAVFKPTFVMLDNRLPDGSGLDFVRYLNLNFPDIKIAFSSGGCENIEGTDLENRIFKVIQKPIDSEKIKEILEELA